MHPFTVISDYSATGEGRTISLWIGYAESEEEARWKFIAKIWQGEFFVIGAIVMNGFQVGDNLVKEMVPREVANRLGKFSMTEFSSQFHFNL